MGAVGIIERAWVVVVICTGPARKNICVFFLLFGLSFLPFRRVNPHLFAYSRICRIAEICVYGDDNTEEIPTMSLVNSS